MAQLMDAQQHAKNNKDIPAVMWKEYLLSVTSVEMEYGLLHMKLVI